MVIIILFYNNIIMIYKGSCHCGAVNFEVETDLKVVKQCNCSICIRKYAKMGMATKEQLKVTKGENNLSLYQFGSIIAKHYFCKTCGVYTHHGRKSDPNGIGFNIGCLDGVDPFKIQSDILDNK